MQYSVLNKMHCVIHPFFRHLTTAERARLLDEIREHLNEKFVKQKKGFATTDQGWRHLGMYDKKLFLFDLADLVDLVTVEEQDSYADEHCRRLENRL